MPLGTSSPLLTEDSAVAARKAVQKRGTKGGVALIPQKHGGALLAGGQKGQTPGTGRPPSAIRHALRQSFDQRLKILETIADGMAVQTLKSPSGKETAMKISADVADRIKAIDMLAKYGLGTTKEVSVEAVRDRVARTLDVIRAQVAPKLAASIIAELRPIWA